MVIHSQLLISQADGRPMYQQLVEQIKDRVAAGDWRPGDEIPSIRVLAATVKVSAITVKRAYLELEREGVIVTRQGKGSFVAADAKLGAVLHEQELTRNLESVARLADVLGLTNDEIRARVAKLRRKGGGKAAGDGTGAGRSKRNIS